MCEAPIEITLDFGRRLHRRARALGDLVRSRAAPRLDQLGGHLDVALHADVLAERKRLIRAMAIREHDLGARRDREGLAMPVKAGESREIGAEPMLRER